MSWTPAITPDIDPNTVDIKKGIWEDPNRNGRIIPYKTYMPQEMGEKLPLIIWSHGLGGTRDGAAFISRYLAANGYIVVHIQHVGTDSVLWEGKPGHPWDNIRNAYIPRSAYINRLKDVPFAFTKILEEYPVDANAIGMSGHSYGALTTQIMAGQRILRAKRAYQYPAPPLMFQAGLLYSPVPTHHIRKQDPQKLYGDIHLPLLTMTGTDDQSPVEGFGYEPRLKIFEFAAARPQHLLVLKDGDHMVYNGSRGQLQENPMRAQHEEIIKIVSLAWWDWHLKKDGGARQWLESNLVKDYLKEFATYQIKN